MVEVLRFVWVWVVVVSDAGTVSHMGGRVDFTLCSRVKHWDRLWSSVVKGEGYWLMLSCSPASPCHPVDSRLRGNDGTMRGHRFHPHL